MNVLQPDIQSIESRNAQLEDELHDALRKAELLQAQLQREREDFERQLARVREGAQQQAARVELDLKDARKARNEFRQVASAKSAEAEEGKRLVREARKSAEEARVQAEKWKAEATSLRTELQTLRATHALSSASPGNPGPSQDHDQSQGQTRAGASVSGSFAGSTVSASSARVSQPVKHKEPRPPVGPVEVIELSGDEDDFGPSQEVKPAAPKTADSPERSPSALYDDHLTSNVTEHVAFKTKSSPTSKPLLKPETPPKPILKRPAADLQDSENSTAPSKRQKIPDVPKQTNASPGPSNEVISRPTCSTAAADDGGGPSATLPSPSPSAIAGPGSSPNTPKASPCPPPRRSTRPRTSTANNIIDYDLLSKSMQLDPDFEDDSVLSSSESNDDDDDVQPRRGLKGKGKKRQDLSDEELELSTGKFSAATGPCDKASASNTSSAVSTSLKGRVLALTAFAVNLSAPSPVAVSRAFLTASYGISGMTMLVKIASEKNAPRGKQRRMIFPRSDNNPSLPSSPGRPGTMLCNRSDVLECGPVALWVKADPAKDNVWRYLGDYELKRSAQSLTAAEARQFPAETVKAWAKTLGNRKHDAYAEIRARIWLRKNKEDVTERAVRRQLELLKDKQSTLVLGQNEIYGALCSGEETLHVLTLRCIGYDHAFLSDIEQRWRSFVPRAKGSRTA